MACTDVKIVHFPTILSALLESMKSLESILTCLEYVGPVKAKNCVCVGVIFIIKFIAKYFCTTSLFDQIIEPFPFSHMEEFPIVDFSISIH